MLIMTKRALREYSLGCSKDWPVTACAHTEPCKKNLWSMILNVPRRYYPTWIISCATTALYAPSTSRKSAVEAKRVGETSKIDRTRPRQCKRTNKIPDQIVVNSFLPVMALQRINSNISDPSAFSFTTLAGGGTLVVCSSTRHIWHLVAI